MHVQIRLGNLFEEALEVQSSLVTQGAARPGVGGGGPSSKAQRTETFFKRATASNRRGALK
jgi:hypothetical protein